MTTREVPVEATEEMMHAGEAASEWQTWAGKPSWASLRAIYKAMLAAAPVHPEGGWQTIDSAKKDGSWVMLWVSPGRLDFIDPAGPVFASWCLHGSAQWVDEHGESLREIATHWQPLPAPPIASSIAGKAE